MTGWLLSAPVLAAGLPVAGFRQLPLPEYTTRYDAIEGAIRMTRGRLKGRIADAEGTGLTVTDADGTDYTVETSDAWFVDAVGQFMRRTDAAVGDYVVLDGYFPKNSTAMFARRLIDVGSQPRV